MPPKELLMKSAKKMKLMAKTNGASASKDQSGHKTELSSLPNQKPSLKENQVKSFLLLLKSETIPNGLGRRVASSVYLIGKLLAISLCLMFQWTLK